VPYVVVIAGPNGAGKSTTAPGLLRDYLGISAFVNADEIARGLAAYDPESVAIEAGRIMLERLRELAARGEDFAFETTLASRSFAPWLGELRGRGYEVHLYYIWVPAAEISVDRVAGRKAAGGHHVPTDVVQRRYGRSVSNFLKMYQPLADKWVVMNNSGRDIPARIASGNTTRAVRVYDEAMWQAFKEIGR